MSTMYVAYVAFFAKNIDNVQWKLHVRRFIYLFIFKIYMICLYHLEFLFVILSEATKVSWLKIL